MSMMPHRPENRTDVPFLSVRGITKSFGPIEVLHGVDLDLAAGTVTALLGENGAGKSTFVRIIAGDHTHDGGQINIDGRPLAIRSVTQARDAGIRLIAQELADAPTLTVAENISLGELPARFGMVRRGKCAGARVRRWRISAPISRSTQRFRAFALANARLSKLPVPPSDLRVA
nr:ATP-binding cassette domain-containing protein [Marinicella sp. W31]MDC2875458.1 ATP-binding cassette domain-containing protein [Marinicella sp. W31]